VEFRDFLFREFSLVGWKAIYSLVYLASPELLLPFLFGEVGSGIIRGQLQIIRLPFIRSLGPYYEIESFYLLRWVGGNRPSE